MSSVLSCLEGEEYPFYLPREVIYYILDFLPAETLVKCSAVCKQWREVASDESFWRRTCRLEGWGKLEEKTWRECAISHLKELRFVRFFGEGECLKHAPAIECSERQELSPCDENRIQIIGSTITVFSPTTEFPQHYDFPARIEDYRLFDRTLVFETDANRIVVWDTQTGNTIHQFHENLRGDRTLLEFRYAYDAHTLVTFSVSESEGNKTTLCRVYDGNDPKQNFSFEVDGVITCADLKGKTLAVNVVGFESVVRLIDLKKKETVFYRAPREGSEIYKRVTTIDEMRWEGTTLIISRSFIHIHKEERWEFFTGERTEKTPTPLKLLP